MTRPDFASWRVLKHKEHWGGGGVGRPGGGEGCHILDSGMGLRVWVKMTSFSRKVLTEGSLNRLGEAGGVVVRMSLLAGFGASQLSYSE